MNDRFFKFPHTAHIAWFGEELPRADKLASTEDVKHLFEDDVVIEEKIDGANIGISIDETGIVRVQNRGAYLEEPFSGQFSRLTSWLAQHEQFLNQKLNQNIILFGEWCAAVHSIEYTRLPDLFLLFDVYDRDAEQFWSTDRRNAIVEGGEIHCVPRIQSGRTNLTELIDLLSDQTSRYGDQPAEGLVVRRDDEIWSTARGKLVRKEFVQTIDEHWKSKRIRWNRLEV
ncbi:MAG: DNA ligase [Rhodospirillaceae bacterium]|nr:DNA ligase [Rhodospirillaceae bacterium]|tara:strand:+ start:541 stop:1224 length:684 start_codon:yes stop_codon:yes gene_type:complete